ncbi:MAG: acetate--CoA ligase family protein [Sneathiellaceae bacterium]
MTSRDLAAAPGGRHKLDAFFWPRAIAVVGASDDTTIIRGKLMEVLLQHDFDGPIYPISPSRREIRGLPAYPSLAEVPGPVDLALVAVPPGNVLSVVEDCARHGVKGAVIYTSGFAEEGGAAAEQQARISAIAQEAGLHVCGPNAIGFFNLRGRLACTFSPAAILGEPPEGGIERALGRIGIAAQSGGLSFALFNRGLRRRLGFSYVVSTGNEATLEAAEFASYMLQEGGTDVLMLFLESARSADKLFALAREAADGGRPVVVAKVGRSEAGRRAAASHTASLTGSDSAYDAVFRHYGMFRADDQEDMLDIAAALSVCPLPKGNRVAIITSSGGSGAWMADACTQAGLALPQLDSGTQARIAARLPSYGAVDNPVDTTAQGVKELGDIIAMVLDSAAIDAVIVVMPLAATARIPLDAERLRAAVAESGKPVLLYSYTLPSDAARDVMRDVRIPVYDSFTGCARGLAALVDFAAFRRDWAAAPALPRVPDGGRAERIAGLLPAAGTVLAEHRAKALLRDYGFPLPPEGLARTEEEAVATAAGIMAATGAEAVALKIQSPGIPHKTDAGGVALALRTPAEIAAAYRGILAAAARQAPDAEIDGVLVQPMLAPGLEMLAGFVVDDDLGPIVTVGLGGIFVEVLADVASAPAPIDAVQARRLIGRLKGLPLLQGARGRPPLDIAALADFLALLSRLAVDSGDRIRAFDVNPLFVHEEGRGVTVVDATAMLAVQREAASAA